MESAMNRLYLFHIFLRLLVKKLLEFVVLFSLAQFIEVSFFLVIAPSVANFVSLLAFVILWTPCSSLDLAGMQLVSQNSKYFPP